MSIDGMMVSKAFDTIFYACNEVQEAGGCERCPFHGRTCLDDPEVSVNELADLRSASAWQEFLDYADDVYRLEQDVIADYADRERKM